MKIISFNLSKILIEKKQNFQGKIEIAQDVNIKEISQDNIPLTKEDVLKIDFTFLINYSNNIAKLEFEGSLLIIPEKNELKEILRSWKDKKITDEIRAPLFNFIMSKCNIKALSLEDDMGLPYHIPMPKLNPPKKD